MEKKKLWDQKKRNKRKKKHVAFFASLWRSFGSALARPAAIGKCSPQRVVLLQEALNHQGRLPTAHAGAALSFAFAGCLSSEIAFEHFDACIGNLASVGWKRLDGP